MTGGWLYVNVFKELGGACIAIRCQFWRVSWAGSSKPGYLRLCVYVLLALFLGVESRRKAPANTASSVSAVICQAGGTLKALSNFATPLTKPSSVFPYPKNLPRPRTDVLLPRHMCVIQQAH